MQRTASGKEIPEWVYGREILVHKVPEVREDVARYVCEGAEAAVRKIGVDFKVRYVGGEFFPRISGVVVDSTRRDMKIIDELGKQNASGRRHENYLILRQRALAGGFSDYLSLSWRLYSIHRLMDERKINILMIDKPVVLSSFLGNSWVGAIQPPEGGFIEIDAYAEGESERMPHYFRAISFHELLHHPRLSHHNWRDILQEEPDIEKEKTFPLDTDFTEADRQRMETQCTMLAVGDPRMGLCDKHTSQAKEFWKEIEEATGEKFLTREAVA